MKKILLVAILTLLIFVFETKAQIITPVHWSYASKKISKDVAVVFLKATIDEGWHIYSQFVKDGGPVKTTFIFSASKDYDLIGTAIEPKPIIRMEKVFGMKVGIFEKAVVFQQKIRLKKQQVTIKGSLEYMTCNDEKCIPPATEEFSIPLK